MNNVSQKLNIFSQPTIKSHLILTNFDTTPNSGAIPAKFCQKFAKNSQLPYGHEFCHRAIERRPTRNRRWRASMARKAVRISSCYEACGQRGSHFVGNVRHICILFASPAVLTPEEDIFRSFVFQKHWQMHNFIILDTLNLAKIA